MIDVYVKMNGLALMKKQMVFLLITLVIFMSVLALVLFKPDKHRATHTHAHPSQVQAQKPITTIRDLLYHESRSLKPPVIQKIMTLLDCIQHHQISYNPILTIIDYSLPSSMKRLWVFDLQHKKLLFHTYVAHGIKSGYRLTTNFSNKNNSKSSSIGVYKTDKTYVGREGLALKLIGLERGFNDQAENRSVVMHGGWYIKERFIKKYGRAGRSWGCPALPSYLSKRIINTIKNNSLFIAYYPDEAWFSQSKFLQCYGRYSPIPQKKDPRANADQEDEGGIVFADLNHNNHHEENEPIIAITADEYVQTFNQPAPLNRMLRRKLKHQEYIALTINELRAMDPLHASLVFITPSVIMHRGYYLTKMNPHHFGRVTQIQPQNTPSVIITFDSGTSLVVKTTDQFIRWVGV